MPGHPYRTDELARKRAEQRRILRGFPDWIVENARLNRPGPRLADPDDALVERELRRLADRELEPLRSWLGVWRSHTESELLERWFARAEIGAALDDVAGEVHEAHELNRLVEYPAGLFPVVLRVVALLAWADEQAGDYADPRLRRYHAAWRTPPAAQNRPPDPTRRAPGPPRRPVSAPDATDFWDPPRHRAGPTRDARSRPPRAPAPNRPRVHGERRPGR